MRELLAALGARVRVERLPAGDYVVAERCLVERKHVVDLHDSLMRGRLWPQLGRLRVRAAEAYLMVEGRDPDGPIGPAATRGALLAATDLGIDVVRSTDRADSAAWLYRLAHRRQVLRTWRNRPRYAQRPAVPPDLVPEAMLSAIPGVSTVTAKLLLDRFGSVAAVATASPAALARTPAIGPKRSAAIAAAFGPAQSTSRADVSRNGRRRAT